MKRNKKAVSTRRDSEETYDALSWGKPLETVFNFVLCDFVTKCVYRRDGSEKKLPL